jgi:transcriptional regulator with XRE-family HTH domain
VRTEVVGMSAQQLADRTAELGMPVSRPVIADLENGRRRYVTTTELIALAQALRATSPLDLLYPEDLAEIEAVAGQVVPRVAAVRNFTGIEMDEDRLERKIQRSKQLIEELHTALNAANAANAVRLAIEAEIEAARIGIGDGG